MIYFNTKTLQGSTILLLDPDVSFYTIVQSSPTTINLYAPKRSDQTVEIFEVNFEQGSLNKIDQLDLSSYPPSDFEILPNRQNPTLVGLDELEIDGLEVIQVSVISPEWDNSWTLQMEDTWGIDRIQMVDDMIIFGESSRMDSRTIFRLVFLDSGSNRVNKIDLLEYDDQQGGSIHEIFELNRNKLAIVIADTSSSAGFYDVQVLTRNPTDLEGLVFSHWLMPHLLATFAMMIVMVIILSRKTMVEPSSEPYPKS